MLRVSGPKSAQYTPALMISMFSDRWGKGEQAKWATDVSAGILTFTTLCSDGGLDLLSKVMLY